MRSAHVRPIRRLPAIALSLVSTLIALYAIEALFTFASPDWIDRFAITLRRGPSVIAETLRLRDEGIAAYPYLQPDTFTDSSRAGLSIGGDDVVAPLSGIGDELTVLCNETGTTVAYRSDSLGFRNPPDAWETPRADVAIIGDSFAQGFCRPEPETIAGRLRHAGIRTINAGLTGAGPLAELGVLREFVLPAKPRVVLWLFYEGNDLIDLEAERNTVHRRYIDKAFTQNLLGKRRLVNAAMTAYADSLVGGYSRPGVVSRVRGFLILRQLRTATGLYRGARQAGARDERQDLEMFRQILLEARAATEASGGELRLVYLPERRRFNRRTAAVVGENHDPREVERGVLRIASELGIPVINVASAFAATVNPAALWKSRRYHYNAAGYDVAAQAIIASFGM